jgi:hypothetical protein
LGSRSDAAVDRIHSAVINVLSSVDPAPLSTVPPVPDQAKIGQVQAKVPQRWIDVSIETEIIEGLTLLRNVRNIAVERYVADSDPQDSWNLLSDRLSRGIGAHPPVVHVTSGGPVSSDAYVSLFGHPWRQQSKAGTFIYAMLLKGSREADASLQLRSSDGTVPLACGSTFEDPIPVKDCVSDFDRWSKGTTRLAVLNTSGPLPVGNDTLELKIKETGEVRTDRIDDRSTPETVLAAGDAGLVETLRCFASISPVTPLAPLADQTEGMPTILPGSPDNATVLLGRESGRLWIYPADIDPAMLADVKKDAHSVPGKTVGLDQPLAGLWLFPYVVRSDGLAPGVGQMLATPLAATRSGPSSPLWDADPAAGLSAPTSIWMSRYDARPVLFAYAMDNYVRYTQRISPASALPVGWRIDLSAGRKGGGRSVVWVFQLDLAQQGLLLGTGCWPISEPAAPEPAYDSARFVPFWSTILEAIRTSADKGTEAAVLTAASDSEPVPVLLDDATKRQIHMRVARFGMLLALAGMLMHAILMVSFRFSVANRRRRAPRRQRGP